ncbi:MAG: xanthine dehydrogenase family protein molybdopterin-binding subunit [Ardenticatenaceae bacterium]|nr:xanthine dehydrogenase family protein molybdopterin-binding subunit [Ardenticatenaceae bacterium]
MTEQYKYLGKPRKLIDGLEKVTGYAQYTADLQLPGMLYIRPIFSPYAHALITAVDKSAALEMPGVVAVLTAEDLPTFERVSNSRNSAVLAKKRVQWAGQPVAVVVASSEAEAADAAEMVFIDYDPLPAAIDMMEAIKPEAPTVWPNGMPEEGDDLASLHTEQVEGQAADDAEKLNNVLNENHFERGDVAADFAASDIIKEHTFDIRSLHQAYLEPHAVTAEPDPLGRRLTIYTSTQGMYGVRSEVARLLGLPQHAVTVKPMTVGGAFGAKYGIYEPLAAAVALTVRRPVRLFLSRTEDFISTTPAPRIRIELKTGFKNDGTTLALQAKVFADNGLFGFGHGGIVATLMAGYYKWNSVKIDTYEVHTHKLAVGAYRAPGAPQGTFAIESIMDDVARELNIDPLDLRLKNAVEGGDFTGTGRSWPQQLGVKKVLERAKEHPLWKNRQPGDGTGVALGGWPSFMGSADATCRVDTDGRVRINLGIVDISGVKSGFVLVAAEALGVSPDDIEIVQDDTNGAYGPNSGGSQVTYTVAGAVHSAALEARKQLVDQAAEMFEAAPEDIELIDSHAQVVGVPDKKIHIGKLAEAARGKRGGPGPIKGDGKSAPPENGPGFVVQITKINRDLESGEIVPVAHVTIQDVGFAINPLLAEGQIQGGTLQSIGMGLYEGMVHDENGTLLTGSFMDYGLPRSDNSPELEVILVDNPSPHGPFGARGIGEPPITAGAAALANAVRDATGARVTQLPITAERLWRALASHT